MSENLLKKVTISHIVGTITAPPVGEYNSLAVIIGHAKSHAPKTTAYGDSTMFSGDFKGINTDTGEEFRSSTCYLPDVASSLLKSAIDSSGGVVEFGFEIGIVGVKGKKDGEANKYEYRCKPLMKASENDPMAVLENKLKQGLIDAPGKAVPNKAVPNVEKKVGK